MNDEPIPMRRSICRSSRAARQALPAVFPGANDRAKGEGIALGDIMPGIPMLSCFMEFQSVDLMEYAR